MAELTRSRLDKQIQKAPKMNMIPVSDVNGELQYGDLYALVRSAETMTHLNSVEIVAGNLVIKYTGEDGNQQVVATKMSFSETDINVSDAKLDNPSAGVYRLIITETDGSTYPVDLSALLAVVTKNTTYITLDGDGTPANPLKADLTDTFWSKIPKTLDDLTDVTATEQRIAESNTEMNGDIALVYDLESRQWVPRKISSLNAFYEVTESFTDVNRENSVTLQMDISKMNPQSIKVFRNGYRQLLGVDYAFEGARQIVFTTDFTGKYPETVIVDYRPATY